MAHSFTHLVDAQRHFFAQGHTHDYHFRHKQLCTLKRMLKKHQSQLLDVLHQDLGKPLFEAYISDWYLCMQELDIALQNLSRWTNRTRVPSSPFFLWASSSYIKSEPYGVNLIIAPWNYPLNLIIIPLIHAIAAGNCAILKPSEHAPHTAQLIAQLIKEYFPAEYITVVEGDLHAAIGLLQERFDFIFFTGSKRVGFEVMKAAANHITPLVLELGGKNPCIIDASASVKWAAWRVMWGKFFNAGQNCLAPDYVLIHQSAYQDFIHHALEALKSMYGIIPQESPDYARMVNDAHMQRLIDLLAHSTIVHGGTYDRASRYFAPTLITDISLDHPSMKEEIFGPILPIIVYESSNQVIEYVQANPDPIALYIFSNKNIDHLMCKIRSGSVCVNDTLLQISNSSLPFGGIGRSGFGAYHGKKGFDTFSHQRAVMHSSFYTGLFRYPPYRWIHKRLTALLQFLVR